MICKNGKYYIVQCEQKNIHKFDFNFDTQNGIIGNVWAYAF
jgi:hypothetical protein